MGALHLLCSKAIRPNLKLRARAKMCHCDFHPRLKAPYRYPLQDSKGRLQVLFLNIWLEWKWLKVTNALAYFDMDLSTAVESFKFNSDNSSI
jgi:hypothetical protein